MLPFLYDISEYAEDHKDADHEPVQHIRRNGTRFGSVNIQPDELDGIHCKDRQQTQYGRIRRKGGVKVQMQQRHTHARQPAAGTLQSREMPERTRYASYKARATL